MKVARKNSVLVWLFITTTVSFMHESLSAPRPELMNYSIAQKKVDEQTLVKYKNHLQNYYNTGIYEKEVADICHRVRHYFANIVPTHNSIVIFDVDDTALYHFHRNKKFEFIWSRNDQLLRARRSNDGLALKPVLNLYTMLQKSGFKIIFLTGRDEKNINSTHHELVSAGYDNFEQLILLPHTFLQVPHHSIKVGEWKLEMRKKLAQTYTIVGTIGDRLVDFVGGYTGFEVKLPNYLY